MVKQIKPLNQYYQTVMFDFYRLAVVFINPMNLHFSSSVKHALSWNPFQVLLILKADNFIPFCE